VSRIPVGVGLVNAAIAVLFTTACTATTGSPHLAPAPAEGHRVRVDGLSFEVPRGWTTLDPDDVADRAGSSKTLSALANRVGMTNDQVVQRMRAVDAVLYRDEGVRNGLVDTISVFTVPGAGLPDEEALEQEFLRLGADVHVMRRQPTDAGDTIVAEYSIAVGGHVSETEVVVVDTGVSVVSVTVRASERATVEDLGGRVVDTLAGAS